VRTSGSRTSRASRSIRWTGKRSAFERPSCSKILREDKLVATVTKKLLTFLHQHYTIQVEGGVTYEAEGNVTSHEYEVTSNGAAVAHISKDWFTVADSYGVAIGPGQDPALLLAAAICIDEIAEEQREHH